MESRIALRVSASAVVLLLGFTPRVEALDRWRALALIESGENDGAIGAAGEVSRYQIKPGVWRRYAPSKTDWENPRAALSVAMRAMRDRAGDFERAYRRPPSDFEFYVLWNAPAQVSRPSKVVRKRAERFCNLLNQGADGIGTAQCAARPGRASG